ncbi:hypothetical protein [Sulfitobacter mediterraneus]|uniref:DNA-binding protein n=1 Tax=Sulfitobacter mediterraneus TaxID=83219 RepID=A0A061SQJ7_9RHOB|nr:hypothetical protein [Sulfitobacter mediterraneus]KAJ01535.1 hypothetical protein PM02_18805 [Sulfitobacter mediterraneus]
MSKRFRTRGIKSNKAYQVDELADVAGVSILTVRNWIRAGMAQIDDQRPTMILGFQALNFLVAHKAKAKRPMAMHEFYCMRCKAPRSPLGGLADFDPSTPTSGRLKALCSVCECVCNRNISAKDLPEVSKTLDVEIRGTR